jgi:hypothetical protein
MRQIRISIVLGISENHGVPGSNPGLATYLPEEQLQKVLEVDPVASQVRRVQVNGIMLGMRRVCI